MAERSLDVVLGAKDKTATGINSALGKISSFSKTAQNIVAGVFQGVGQKIADVALGALKSLGEGFNLAANFEQAQVALETMLGSGEKAKTLLKELSDFAAATPFEFPELVDASKKLIAFGIDAKELVPTLRSIGDIASGVGVPVSELAEIFGKAKVQGRLMAEDINQLTGRGIPIIQELAKQFGVAESEVRGLVTAGAIGFPQLDKAFKDLTSGGGKFTGMMEKQSRTVTGLMSTLKDSIGMTMKGVAESIIEGLNLRGAISSVTSMASSIGPILQTIAKTVTGWIMDLVGSITKFSDFMKPIWQGTWDWMKAVVVAWGEIIGGAVSNVKETLGPIFTAIGDMLTSFGITLENVKKGVIIAFATLEFQAKNWKEITSLSLLTVTLGVVRFANIFEHLFTEVVPKFLKWFADNWRDIFTTLWNFTKTVTTNMFENLKGFFTAVMSWLSGDGFDFKWTGLLEGFENTIKELPKIMGREKGALEQELESSIAALSASLGTSFVEFIKQKLAALSAPAIAAATTQPTTGPTTQPASDSSVPTVPGMGKAAKRGSSKFDFTEVGALRRGFIDQTKGDDKAVEREILAQTKSEVTETRKNQDILNDIAATLDRMKRLMERSPQSTLPLI